MIDWTATIYRHIKEEEEDTSRMVRESSRLFYGPHSRRCR